MAQEGIAKSVGIRRDNVPRAMKSLKEQGLMIEKVLHVTGVKRKRKVYFLTPEGTSYANQIKMELERTVVEVVDEEGGLHRLAIKDINGHFGLNLTLLELLTELEEVGQIDIRQFSKSEGALERRNFDENKFIIELGDAPQAKFFVGRDDEIKKIEKAIKSADSRVVVLNGIAGIGKTTLASKVVRDHLQDKNVFWYRFHKWDTLRNTLVNLADFLSRLQRKRLKSYLASHSSIEMEELPRLIADDLAESNTILVFDDFQRVKSDIVEFFGMLDDILGSIQGCTLITVGRQIMPYYDRGEVLVEKRVLEIRLDGLDEEAARKLLKVENITDVMFEKIYMLTKGHPLFLELITSVRDIREQRDIKRYIYEEIFSKLADEEKLLLQIVSVFRYPVSSTAFFIDESVSFSTLDKLVERNLMQEISYDEYDVHDLIREFFYTRLPPPQKKQYHASAADYYMEQGVELSKIEAQYHFLYSDQADKAVRLAINHGGDLISRGYVERFLEILDEYTQDNTPDKYWAELMLVKAEVLNIMGEWDEAIGFYRQTILLCENKENNLALSETHRRLGDMLTKLGLREQAGDSFRTALDISTKIEDSKGIADSYRGLGHLANSRGDFATAIEFYEKGMEQAEKVQDLTILTKIYTDLGTVYSNAEDYDLAIKFHELAITVLEQTGDVYEQGKLYNNLGMVYMNKGVNDRALNYFEDCIKLSETNGDVRQLGYGLASAGLIYAKEGDFSTALEYLDEAMEIFDKLGERFKIGMVSMDYATVYSLEGDQKRAQKWLEDSIAVFQEIKLPYYEAKASEKLAKVHKELGNQDKTKEYMRKANKLFQGVGFTTKVKKIRKGKPQGLGENSRVSRRSKR